MANGWYNAYRRYFPAYLQSHQPYYELAPWETQKEITINWGPLYIKHCIWTHPIIMTALWERDYYHEKEHIIYTLGFSTLSWTPRSLRYTVIFFIPQLPHLSSSGRDLERKCERQTKRQFTSFSKLILEIIPIPLTNLRAVTLKVTRHID